MRVLRAIPINRTARRLKNLASGAEDEGAQGKE
jgi:hypothetical protein